MQLPIVFFGKKNLPVILQSEASECGLACLCMIANFHGHDVDLNGLRQRFSTSLKGVTLDRLIDIASHLNLGARALRVELDALSKISVPAILHWDLNHFVVLKKITGNKLHIHDPASGFRVINIDKASDHFTGVVLELNPTANFKKQSVRNKMRFSQLWDKLVGLKPALIQLFILSIILQFIALIMPLNMQIVVDEVLVKFDHNLLLVLTIGFLGLALISELTSFMRGWVIMYFGNQFYFQMFANLFKHLLHLPVSFFEKRHLGDILSRMGSTQPIQTALSESVVAAIIDGIMAITTGIVIFIYSTFLGTIVALTLLLNITITFLIFPTLRRMQEEAIVIAAKESTHTMETVRASTTIRLFEFSNQRLAIWRNLFTDKINAEIAIGKYELILSTVHGIIGNVSLVLVIYLGAQLILSGESNFTVGMFFAFMSYRGNFMSSTVALIGKIIEFRLLGLHLERIADIAQAKPEIPTISFDQTIENHRIDNIQIKNVSFQYSNSEPWVLRNINLSIKSEDFIVFIGPSGEGKTTLMKLILGLYRPSEGEILINGHPLSYVNLSSWRKQIGTVLQDDQLFSGSIADNISFFSPEHDLNRIRSVAKEACIDEEIMAMPMNYLSRIGDMGSALSGGQIQRLLIARSFYRNPNILCFDEGTANIDKQTEVKIINNIESKPIIRLIVAHRTEFIERAQRKILISGGQAKEIFE